MEVNREFERRVLLKKIEQIRRLMAATLDQRMVAGMKELLHELEEQLRNPGIASPKLAPSPPQGEIRMPEPTE